MANDALREAWVVVTSWLLGIQVPAPVMDALFSDERISETEAVRRGCPQTTLAELVSAGAACYQTGAGIALTRRPLQRNKGRLFIDWQRFGMMVKGHLVRMHSRCSITGSRSGQGPRHTWLQCTSCGLMVSPFDVTSTACSSCGTEGVLTLSNDVFIASADDLVKVLHATGIMYMLEVVIPREVDHMVRLTRVAPPLRRQQKVAVEVTVTHAARLTFPRPRAAGSESGERRMGVVAVAPVAPVVVPVSVTAAAAIDLGPEPQCSVYGHVVIDDDEEEWETVPMHSL